MADLGDVEVPAIAQPVPAKLAKSFWVVPTCLDLVHGALPRRGAARGVAIGSPGASGIASSERRAQPRQPVRRNDGPRLPCAGVVDPTYRADQQRQSHHRCNCRDIGQKVSKVTFAPDRR